MSSQLAIAMARDLLQEVEAKETLMVRETGRLLKLLVAKKSNGRIEFIMRDKEPEVWFEDKDLISFTVYSFSKIEHIKASFQHIEFCIKTGSPPKYSSSVEFADYLRQHTSL